MSEPPSASPAVSRPKAPRWAEIVGTFFYIGFFKPGPGTWAALATAIIWWFAATPGRLGIGVFRYGFGLSEVATVVAAPPIAPSLVGRRLKAHAEQEHAEHDERTYRPLQCTKSNSHSLISSELNVFKRESFA